MTKLSLTSRVFLGAALSAALLGGCNKRAADQPPTPSVNTPEPASPATPPATPNNTSPGTPNGATPPANPPAQGSAPPSQ